MAKECQTCAVNVLGILRDIEAIGMNLEHMQESTPSMQAVLPGITSTTLKLAEALPKQMEAAEENCGIAVRETVRQAAEKLAKDIRSATSELDWIKLANAMSDISAGIYDAIIRG